LVDAAEQLLESGGISAVTVRSVARASGMSHGAPRRYFPTVQAIHAATAHRGLDELRSRTERVVSGQPDARSRLRAAALEYVRFAVSRPHMFALMFRHDILADSGVHLRGTSLPLFAFVTALVAPAASSGTHVRAVQLWTAVHGIAALNSTTALSVITDVDVTVLVDAAIDSIVDESGDDRLHRSR
jgi:AcrR family transcriptional regulator